MTRPLTPHSVEVMVWRDDENEDTHPAEMLKVASTYNHQMKTPMLVLELAPDSDDQRMWAEMRERQDAADEGEDEA